MSYVGSEGFWGTQFLGMDYDREPPWGSAPLWYEQSFLEAYSGEYFFSPLSNLCAVSIYTQTLVVFQVWSLLFITSYVQKEYIWVENLQIKQKTKFSNTFTKAKIVGSPMI